MAYLGNSKMGQGSPIPVNPATGQMDINSLVGLLVDQRKDYLYDTLVLAPGTTVTSQPYRLFQVPIGQSDPYNGNQTKTLNETNMRSAGFLPPPFDFIVNNLGFYTQIGANLFDISTFFNMGRFEFTILQKVMFQGHFQRHPSGMGVTGMSTQTTESNWINGIADPKAVWHFDVWRKYIPPQVSFGLNVIFEETYAQLYNTTSITGTSLPANVKAKLFDSGLITATATLPTLLSAALGGNGLRVLCILNGVSNGPVQ
jgi:hypothetical protein